MPCATNITAMAAPDYVHAKLGPCAYRSVRMPNGAYKRVSAILRCANGLEFALRVGEGCCCWPESLRGPWESVELVGLNRSLADLRRYREHINDAIDVHTVRYSKVPVDLVNRIVTRNGGLV